MTRALLLVLSLFLVASVSAVAQDDLLTRRQSSHLLHEELSLYCSDTPISKIDQRLLGHADVTLPMLSYHTIPPMSATTLQDCATQLFSEFLTAQRPMSVERKGDANSDTFHFAHFHHDDSHTQEGAWKFTSLPQSRSGLSVIRIAPEDRSTSPSYFAKFYPYPQAIDAFHAELFANYGLDSLDKKYFQTVSPLLTRKCYLPEKKEVFYVNLLPGASGVSLKSKIDDLYQKPGDEQLSRDFLTALELAGKALGDMHVKSARFDKAGTIRLMSDDSLEDTMQMTVGKYLDDDIVELLVQEMDSMQKKASEAIGKNRYPAIPHHGVYGHFDLSTNNVFVDTTHNQVTLMDSPLMYRSFAHVPPPTQCEDNNYLGIPVLSLAGTTHPAFDYYYMMAYVAAECDQLINDNRAKLPSDTIRRFQNGYCTGYFAGVKEPEAGLARCLQVDYPWGVEIENFYMQYLFAILTPQRLVEGLRQAIELQRQQFQ